MKHWMRLAVVAVGFLAAPASAQRLANFPPAGQVSATDTVLGQQPSLCVSTTTVCNGVLISLAQLSAYILPGGSAPTAAKWATPRTVTATGDVTWTFTLDGSGNVPLATTLATVPITKGGTGATTVAGAQAALNVAAIGADPTYAKLAGAAFTGGLTGTTASFTGAVTASNFSGSSSGTNTGDQTLAGLGGQPASPILSAVAAQVLNADTCVYWTGASSAATYGCPSYGRSLMGSASAAAAQATLGVSATGADPNFAKLAGATFTGGLNGTTGTFSGAVSAGALTANRLTVGTAVVVANGSNFAIGQYALGGNITSASANIAIGLQALGGLTTGGNNMALGSYSGQYVNTGSYNTFMGSGSGAAVTSGNLNVMVGGNAGTAATTGTYSTLVGANAGSGITTGGSDTLVGGAAGSSITTGSNNTIIGRYSGSAAMANNVVLADGNGTARFLFDGTILNLIGPVVASSTIAATTLQASAASTVANLPTCNAAARGTHGVVTDATAPTFLGTLMGGGSVIAPAFCNGSAWIAG